MKYMVDYPISSTADDGAWLVPNNIAEYARTLEVLGIDAIAFPDHPAPSKKWIESGGHESFDPFVGLGFLSAVTSEIRLMTHLSVVPYRNPLLQTKSMTTVDILSGGRTTFILGTGYLRSEFAALGVDFAERNELFDEAIEVMKASWSAESVSYVGRHFNAVAQTMQPRPVQLPHPPLWLGGNSAKARERLARWGDGWAALIGSRELTTTSRTPSITGPADLAPIIRDIERRLQSHHRSLNDIDIMCGGPGATLSNDLSSEERVDELNRLAEIGVTWIQLMVRKGSFGESLDSVAAFVREVSANVV
jgi:probable F420-dependent oxidoreductase